MDTKQKNSASRSEDDGMDLPEIKCDTCKLKFSCVTSYQCHLEGKKHNKMLVKHRAEKLLKKMHLDDVADSKETNGDHEDDPLSDEEFYETLPDIKPYGKCNLCKKVFSGPEGKHQHFTSPAHKKKVAQEKIKRDFLAEKLKSGDHHITINEDVEDDLVQNYAQCKVCEKAFNNPVSLTQHLNSNAHQRRVRESKREGEMKPYSVDSEDSTSYKFKCKNCDVLFLDVTSLERHLSSQSHAKQKNKKDVLALLSKYPEVKRVPLQNIIVTDSADENTDGEQKYYPLDSQSDFFVCKICCCSFSGPESAKDHVLSKRHAKARLAKLMKKDAASSDSDDKEGKTNAATHASVADDDTPVAPVSEKKVPSGSQNPTENGKESPATRVASSPKAEDDFELVF